MIFHRAHGEGCTSGTRPRSGRPDRKSRSLRGFFAESAAPPPMAVPYDGLPEFHRSGSNEKAPNLPSTVCAHILTSVPRGSLEVSFVPVHETGETTRRNRLALRRIFLHASYYNCYNLRRQALFGNVLRETFSLIALGNTKKCKKAGKYAESLVFTLYFFRKPRSGKALRGSAHEKNFIQFFESNNDRAGRKTPTFNQWAMERQRKPLDFSCRRTYNCV